MKLKKRIAAVAAAMVMATSMMMTSASAATGTGSNTDVRVVGYTNKGSVYGYATGKATNNTATQRAINVIAEIYSSSNDSTIVANKQNTANAAANGGTASSGQATYGVTKCDHAVFKATMYNGPTQGPNGVYSTATVSVVF